MVTKPDFYEQFNEALIKQDQQQLTALLNKALLTFEWTPQNRQDLLKALGQSAV